MADRTNAELFGVLFEALAAHVDQAYGDDWEPDVDDDATRLSLLLLSLADEFDFSTYQMDADSALERLGLAGDLADENLQYTTCPRFVDWPDYSDVKLYRPVSRVERPVRSEEDSTTVIFMERAYDPSDLQRIADEQAGPTLPKRDDS